MLGCLNVVEEPEFGCERGYQKNLLSINQNTFIL